MFLPWHRDGTQVSCRGRRQSQHCAEQAGGRHRPHHGWGGVRPSRGGNGGGDQLCGRCGRGLRGVQPRPLLPAGQQSHCNTSFPTFFHLCFYDQRVQNLDTNLSFCISHSSYFTISRSNSITITALLVKQLLSLTIKVLLTGDCLDGVESIYTPSDISWVKSLNINQFPPPRSVNTIAHD